MNTLIINSFNLLCRNTTIFFYILLFFFANSLLHAGTLKFDDGFESANLDKSKCSGNCPSITTSPVKSGKYAGNYILTPNMKTTYRTESVFGGRGSFVKGKEYWMSMDYRLEDWKEDSSPEVAPLQVHSSPSSYGKGCNLGAAVTNAPFVMVTQNKEAFFKTYGGKVLWRGSIQRKKWINIKVHFKLSFNNDGFIEVWKDGVKLGRKNGSTGPKFDNCGKPMKEDYLKVGVYKWDWRKGKIKESVRRQLLIDNVKIVEGSDGNSLIDSRIIVPPSTKKVVIDLSASQTSNIKVPSKNKVVIDTSAPKISNIQASVTGSRAVITWNTDEASSSRVDYGLTTQYEANVNSYLLVTNHSVELKNLVAGKTYHYQIGSKDSNGNIKNSKNLSFTVDSLIKKDRLIYPVLKKVTGTSILDISGNKHTGKLVNGARLIAGQGIKFDGVDDYLDAGKLDVTGKEITLSAWFWTNDLSNCSAHDCRIISKATSLSEQSHYFMISPIKVGSKTRLRFRLKTNGVTSTLIAASGNVKNKRWIHVAAVYDGAAMRLYQDGVEVGSMAKKGHITANNKSSVWIGGNPSNAKSRPWKGHIDDVHIHSYAMTRTDIAAMANSDVPSALVSDILPPKISNVQVAVTDGTARISWKTNKASESLIEYGVSKAYSSYIDDNNSLLVTSHKLELKNLKAGKLYHYQISSQDSMGNVGKTTDLTFKTESIIGEKKGLLAHWSMEEATGARILDMSGNKNIGKLINGARLTSDWGVKFDGVDDYLDAGKLNVTGNAITLSAWFWTNDLSNCSAHDCRIISKATSLSEQSHYFMISPIKVGSKTRLRFRLKTNGVTSTLIAASGNVKSKGWIHVAAVYDGAAMRLYQDGVEVGSMAKKGNITANNKSSVWIGGNPSNAKSRPWKGHIDDVRIYNYAMTKRDIAAMAK